ncbi:hypothetical protein BDZ97DRAFT_1842278 [Flammula alnicola]|nr:hypothetical protein BDZ97DRAFT_1842278 [Flammula alnicola]
MVDEAVRYMNKEEKMILVFAAVADEIQEFKETMHRLVDSAEGLHTSLKSMLDNDRAGAGFEGFTQLLSVEIDAVIEELRSEFSEPLPEDQTERYKKRKAVVSFTLDKIEDAFVKGSSILAIPEADARDKFSDVKRHICEVVLIAAPVFLRPLLVLRVFGFGPLGPVKGSSAAWAQRFFFKATIKQGNWFSRLQSAGMRLGKKLGISVGIGAGIITD